MSTFDTKTATKTAGAEPVVAASSGDDWAAVMPVAVPAEDAMSPGRVAAAWEVIYREVGARSESERKAVRLALYVYATVNGTSSVGKYSGDVTLSNGQVFNASVIPRAVGRNAIREFFRGNMDEAYEALKKSHAIEKLAPRYVMKWEAKGVARDAVFATADYMRNCTKFTPAEANANTLSFNMGVARAAVARKGHSLEEMRVEDTHESLRAQSGAPVGAPVGKGMFDF